MKPIPRKELIKRLDRMRQTYARFEGAKKKNGKWYNRCVSCGAVVECSKANGGHFIPRSCYPLRWDERNVHCQCVRCNLFHSGAYIQYSQWFIKEYGTDVFNRYTDEFRSWQQGHPAIKIDELKRAYDFWLNKIREMEKKTGPLIPKTWVPFGPDFLE